MCGSLMIEGTYTILLMSRAGQSRVYPPYIPRFPCQKYRIYTVSI
jgi:hypothetical protein